MAASLAAELKALRPFVRRPASPVPEPELDLSPEARAVWVMLYLSNARLGRLVPSPAAVTKRMSRKRGRPPIGTHAMTVAERKRRSRGRA